MPFAFQRFFQYHLIQEQHLELRYFDLRLVWTQQIVHPPHHHLMPAFVAAVIHWWVIGLVSEYLTID